MFEHFRDAVCARRVPGSLWEPSSANRLCAYTLRDCGIMFYSGFDLKIWENAPGADQEPVDRPKNL